MSQVPTPAFDVPATISGIRIGECLRTAGPMAVHAGIDALGLEVRVYLVRSSDLGGPPGAEGFLAAVGRAARAQHPSLVPFTTGGRKGPFVFAVTKEVDGRTVDELLSRGGALAVERALSIATAVAGVLAALEQAGTRHGDLTPRRIHLPGRGRVAVRPPRVLPVELHERKARYQAPEEARGGAGDIRSDLFVLGLILVEMLSGRSPLPAGEAAATALAEGAIPPAHEAAPAAPPAVRAVLARLLAVDPAHRFRSADEARHALEEAAADRAPEPAPAATSASAPVGAAPSAVPVAVPVDEQRPETAPISAAAVQQALRAAAVDRSAPAAPPAPVVPRGPPPMPAVVASRREPGRLYVEARLGEALLELAEPVHLGRPEGALDVVAQAEPFDGAVLRIEPSSEGDVLHALTDDVRVGGEAVTERVLEHGDTIEAPRIQARYERTTRLALRAAQAERAAATTQGKGLARGVLIGSVVATLVVIVVALAKIAATGERAGAAEAALRAAQQALASSRDAHAATLHGPSPARSPELAAQTAYEEARATARSRPDEPDVGRHALAQVARRHPGTAYGRLAAIEAAALAEPTATAGDASAVFEALLAAAEADAYSGGLDDALQRLRNYASEHLDTIAAATARRTMVRLEAEMDARIAADMETVTAAMKAGDLRVVMQVTGRMLDYVPWSRRDPVQKAQEEARRRMDAVLGGGGTTSGETPPTQKPPGGDGGPGPEAGTSKPPDVVEPQPPEADRDAAAQAAFQAARRAMSAGEDVDALRGFVDLLRDFKGTPTAEKYAGEVKGRIKALAARPAGVELAFRGAVEKRGKDRYRITYDLSDADQLLDFKDVNAFEAPPRADWQLTSGRVRAKGSGAFVLKAEFLSDFLSFEVEALPERAHDLGVIYMEPINQQRFYLFTIQNSFFQLGKGDGRADFREHAIALFGPDMWRDTPAGEIGFVRKCGSEEPPVVAGRPTTIKCGKSEGEVWMRFEGGRTIRGSAYGDIKYEFKGLSPGVFIVNGAAAFGSMVVEGVPDPAWVARHWDEVIESL